MVVQLVFAVWVMVERDSSDLRFFTFDSIGVLYYTLMVVMAALVYYRSYRYFDVESLREFKIYVVSFVALCLSLTGVYFANNIVVTWIFLEATTIATAGLVYHRRTIRSLEATWKYVFVSSVGIAVAYLGILFLSTAANTGELSYDVLKTVVATGDPLYLKLAFLFIIVGYSCKLEIFPLFTVGVDANHSSPTPASAFISTALVNGGFVSVFRVYDVMRHSAIYGWVQSLMLIIGLLSILMAAIYIARTGNLKRMLAYSTVENGGIMALGLGLGGIATAAVFIQSVAHTLFKGGLMLGAAQVGKIFGNYQTGRLGSYFKVYNLGALVMLLGMVGVMALPPSAMFVSEFMIIEGLFASGYWWIVAIFGLLICWIMYWFGTRIIAMLYKPVDVTGVDTSRIDRPASYMELALILIGFVLAFYQPPFFTDILQSIVN